jgi:uncharacterized protein (TIGR02145 family)
MYYLSLIIITTWILQFPLELYSQVPQSYNTVSIAGKQWTVSNLNKKVFNTGESLFEAKTLKDWKHALENKIPAYCEYPNSNGKYGLIYNMYAIVDLRGLAPEGFRLATLEDWKSIENLHKDTSALCLRSNEGYFKGNNMYGFNALPAGYLSHYNDACMFWGHDYMTAWFTDNCGMVFCFSEVDAFDIDRGGYDFKELNRCNIPNGPFYGAYVRCIKE